MAKCLRLFMERPAPPPFVWPEGVPSGLEAFIARVEKKLEEKGGNGPLAKEQL
jgi:hypothetical protein